MLFRAIMPAQRISSSCVGRYGMAAMYAWAIQCRTSLAVRSSRA